MNNKTFDANKKQIAINWLGSKNLNKCECCGANNWIIPDDLVMPMTYTGGGLEIGGPSYPQFMSVCSNCGNTKYFNAVVAGIIPSLNGGSNGE